MQYDVKVKLLTFFLLVVFSGGLFGICYSNGVSTPLDYIYLASAFCSDMLAYFMLDDAYEKYSST